ncbi:hypothetical protein [Streptomyces sp. ST1020]|uniref:hypothetical protein n=1 Tax=Streptomyces sp. ST1020 TaxID=1848901 RepID=UPI0034C68E3E
MTTSSEQRGTAAPAGGLTDAKKALLALRLHGRPAARPAGTARGAGISGLPPGTRRRSRPSSTTCGSPTGCSPTTRPSASTASCG